jgi:hypothetical protein
MVFQMQKTRLLIREGRMPFDNREEAFDCIGQARQGSHEAQLSANPKCTLVDPSRVAKFDSAYEQGREMCEEEATSRAWAKDEA